MTNMERKSKLKSGTLLKRKTETSTLHQNGIINTKNPEKTSKQKSRKNEREKEQNSTPQISTGTRRFNSRNCLILGQLNVNKSQPSLEQLNFTVRNASEISDNSFQVSNFHFQIGTLMSKDHAHEQKLLVLFRAPSPQKPPVTNCQQSTT
jgi:hypothetical protein